MSNFMELCSIMYRTCGWKKIGSNIIKFSKINHFFPFWLLNISVLGHRRILEWWFLKKTSSKHFETHTECRKMLKFLKFGSLQLSTFCFSYCLLPDNVSVNIPHLDIDIFFNVVGPTVCRIFESNYQYFANDSKFGFRRTIKTEIPHA